MRIIGLLLLVTLFWGCPGPTPVDTQDQQEPLADQQFTYDDIDAELYFAVRPALSFSGTSLDTAGVIWWGTGGFQGNTDSIFFNDDGVSGDILAGDGIYSRKVNNDTTVLSNFITTNDSGLVYYKFFAEFGDTIFTISDSVHLGNLSPVLLGANLDTNSSSVAMHPNPATDYVVTRPNNHYAIWVLVRAEVTDPNGLDDINWVGFTSLHVEPDTLMNSGQLIHLYDDGSSVELYPGFTSGDETEDDGIFSFSIPIYGITSTTGTTKTGAFKWSFQAADKAGERTEIATLNITVL